MIALDKYEKEWIKICKGQSETKYPFQKTWVKTLKPLYKDIYYWNPDDDKNYKDYLVGVFQKLLDIHLKIADDQSDTNNQLLKIFGAAFNKSDYYNDDLSIERAISSLCDLIRYNEVCVDGKYRYLLY